jgi:hypothetical protein
MAEGAENRALLVFASLEGVTHFVVCDLGLEEIAQTLFLIEMMAATASVSDAQVRRKLHFGTPYSDFER